MDNLYVWHGKKQLKKVKCFLLGTEGEEGEDSAVGNSNKSLRLLNINDQSKIYIEEVKKGEDPKWPFEFEKESYRIIILFNNPYT